jgi:prepilin-type N-terminal cleavage/methylation domain-containing protein
MSLKGEEGFTLPEMMVTIMIMVLFALYSIFDMSMKVFSFGNDKVEAAENARIGLAKMAREIRAAYPYDKGAGQDHLLWSPGYPTTGAIPPSDRISFGNDLGTGNRVIDPNTEAITYSLNGSTLYRTVGTGSPQPVVEHIRPDDPQTAVYDGGLEFEYLTSSGTDIVTATSEAEVEIVRITLAVDKNGRIQELTTDVNLRNRR